MTTSILPDSLVTTDWLAEHLDEPTLRVVDIRGYVNSIELSGGKQDAVYVGALEEYEAGHVPGAVYVDWTKDITDPNSPVKVQIAPPDLFADAMEIRGIGDDTDVVIVDHSGGHFATRLWWALRYYGHDRAAVLDGGFKKWQREERPLSTSILSPERALFTPSARPEIRVEVDEVATLSQDGGDTLLVDVRDNPTYRGDVFRGARAGHIPNAVNISAKSLVNDDGTWKSRDDQAQILADGGVQPGQRVVAYCNGGVTATAVLFALHRTGHDEFANYDGSWNEWSERLDLPVRTGDS